jgi:hypothetical protein
VKGGGHSYQGTSTSADSLLIWTRAMNDITLHDDFIARGCEGKQPPQPAVTVGAGAMWMQTYNAVTTVGGRYVQEVVAARWVLQAWCRVAGSEVFPSTMEWLQRLCSKRKL